MRDSAACDLVVARRTCEGVDGELGGTYHENVGIFRKIVEDGATKALNQFISNTTQKENAKPNVGRLVVNGARASGREQQLTLRGVYFHDQAFRSAPRCSKRFSNHENDF